MKRKKLDHLDLVCLEIAKYNKIHNTYYSYGEYTALVREGKIISDVATEKQRKWIKRLREQGNLALVCYGWEEASAVLLKYIKLKADSEDEKL